MGLKWGGLYLKTLLLVAKREYAKNLYYSELKKVFGNRLNIISCHHIGEDNSDLPTKNISGADIVLITNVYSFPVARRQMGEDANIINLDFTFSREKVEELKKLPVGTDALACFNYYSSAHQAVNALYEAGVSNLNLFVDYPGNRNTVGKKIDLAIVSDHIEEIPEFITRVFDLGPRKIALSTLLDIAIKANILDDEIMVSIKSYCEDIATPTSYLAQFYDFSSATTLQLKTMMECIDYGVVIYNDNSHIINYNKNFVQVLKLPSNLYKMNLNELLKNLELNKFLNSKKETYNQLCTLKEQGISLSVTKRKINNGINEHTLYMLIIKDITELTDMEASLRRQLTQKGLIAKYTFSDIKGSSPAMEQCLNKAKKIAQIDKPTLIIGESGTGKELFVQSIHNASSRSRYPFVAMNCAAIPDSLLESELFGYEEGAFTGARKGGKEGLFQLAQKGTLFLDEIGELSISTQAKLLRVLEEKEIMRVGSEKLTSVDVRIIAATNRNLKALVDEGKFRLDLFFRLNTLVLNIPPLRLRNSDIALLINEYIRKENQRVIKFDPKIWNFLLNYQWPGNVRELRNCIEYAANISDGYITVEHLPDYILQEYDNYDNLETDSYFDDIKDNISNNDKEYLLKILKLLKYKPMGRRTLMQSLKEKNVDITEYQLRNLLNDLCQNNCIIISKGRLGCSLTDSGKELLDTLSQEA